MRDFNAFFRFFFMLRFSLSHSLSKNIRDGWAIKSLRCVSWSPSSQRKAIDAEHCPFYTVETVDGCVSFRLTNQVVLTLEVEMTKANIVEQPLPCMIISPNGNDSGHVVYMDSKQRANHISTSNNDFRYLSEQECTKRGITMPKGKVQVERTKSITTDIVMQQEVEWDERPATTEEIARYQRAQEGIKALIQEVGDSRIMDGQWADEEWINF